MSSVDRAVPPDFLSYHRSLQTELDAIRNRVRNLIQHRATDGAFKEAALRNVIRRHIPEPLFAGTGFVVTREACSSQIDILVVDKSLPTLFQDGDLVIVTPEAARAAIEVKTTLIGQQAFQQAFSTHAANQSLCFPSRNLARNQLWTGLFAYNAVANQERNLLLALKRAADETRMPVKCVAYGSDVLIQFVNNYQVTQDVRISNGWICWNTPGLAASFFLTLLLDHFGQMSVYSDRAAWFPQQPTNRPTLFVRAYEEADVQEFPTVRSHGTIA